MESCGAGSALTGASRTASLLLLLCLTCFGSGMKVDPPPYLRKLSAESQKIEDAISRLWSGEELDADEVTYLRGQLTYHQVNMSNVRAGVKKTPTTLNMVILGPFCSGTNLLYHTMRLNYPALVKEACGHSPICRIWKHGLNISSEFFVEGEEPLETVLKHAKMHREETVLVVIVRSPLAQIAAWQLFPYQIWPCINRSVDTYNQPCTSPGMTWRMKGDEDYWSSTTFDSTMDIYNRYLQMYRRLQQSGRYHDVVFLTYEDLVFAPQDVVAEVASTMGWPVPEKVAVLGIPAKKHGHYVGRDDAVKRNVDRWWLSHFSSEARELVCQGLDPEAYRSLEENGYRVPGYPVVAYGDDCNLWS